MARLEAIALTATLAGLSLWPAQAGAARVLNVPPPSLNGVPLSDPDFLADVMPSGNMGQPMAPPPINGGLLTLSHDPYASDPGPGGRREFTRPFPGGVKVDPIVAGPATQGCLGSMGCFNTKSPGGSDGASGGPIPIPIGFGSSVPEPTAWALLLAGFAGLGGALRTARRRPSLLL
jgi:hypothetical protein